MSRLTILNFGLRYIGRPLLARTKSPQQAEMDFRRTARFAFLRPRNLTFERLDGSLARITCGPVDDSAAILYFHGGGYVAGSAWTHRAMLGRLSLLAGVPVFAADYRWRRMRHSRPLSKMPAPHGTSCRKIFPLTGLSLVVTVQVVVCRFRFWRHFCTMASAPLAFSPFRPGPI